MPGLSLIFFQLAAAQAVAGPAPDIELNARVTAKEVTVRQDGEARLDLYARPGSAAPVKVIRSEPAGKRSYRNLTIDLHAEARLADPAQAKSQLGNKNGSSSP